MSPIYYSSTSDEKEGKLSVYKDGLMEARFFFVPLNGPEHDC